MDIATVWDAAATGGDWALAAGALQGDAGLRSAIAISLFTDRTANADDVLPGADDDRRGWWGDLALEGAAPDPIGSRLWLLAREKATEQTRRRAELYIREALAWIITDRIAAAIEIETEWQGEKRDRLAIRITLRRQSGTAVADSRFDFVWALEGSR